MRIIALKCAGSDHRIDFDSSDKLASLSRVYSAGWRLIDCSYYCPDCISLCVELTGWLRGLNKIEAIKCIRAMTGCGLADAKRSVDAVLSGDTVQIWTSTTTRHDYFVKKLTDIGIVTVVKSN